MTERVRHLAKLGATALKLYVNHLLVFSIGATLGAVVGMTASMAVFLALLQSRGLL